GGMAAFYPHGEHFGSGGDLHAACARFLRDRFAHRAHAAERVSPGSALAVYFAESVVQQHVGGAGRVRAREVPDLRVESEHRLDRVALEPPVEELARALRDDLPQIALRAARKERKLPAERERTQAAAPAHAEVGRCLEV